jgi:hypothetical protein
MELSLITPPAFVEYTELLPGRFCVGSVAARDNKYRDFFKESAKKGYCVILDNGAFEKELLSFNALRELACEIGASVVIAPDIYGGNTQESLALSQRYADEFLAKVPYSLMLVLQCAPGQILIDEMLEGLPSVFSWIGFPRILAHNLYARQTHCSEQELLRFLLSSDIQTSAAFDALRKRKIHFLGLGDELFMLPYFWWVDSIDTASLFWQAACGNKVTEDGFLHTRISRPSNYFSLTRVSGPGFVDCLEHNCKRALEWAEKANERRRTITGNLY